MRKTDGVKPTPGLPPVTLWVEALSSVRSRGSDQPQRPMQYRVRGLPANFDIRILRDGSTERWRIDRGNGDGLEGDYDTPSAALSALEAEFNHSASGR